MKIGFKKITALLLLAAVLSSLTVSCRAAGGENAKPEENTGGAAETDTGEGGGAAPPRLYPDLNAADFGGYEFTFLTRTISNADWAEWDHRDIYAGQENGDIINDAVYIRNRKIEEKYNIKIDEVRVENPLLVSKTQQAVKAGDDFYDAVCPHLMEVTTLAQGGNLMDLFLMPNIDLTMPWWNQGSVRDLSICKRLFVVSGDLFILDNDSLEAMVFNKALIQTNGLEIPYDIVKRGEWTFDKLIEMGKGIAKDLNGDGKMYIKDDLFGIIIQASTENSFIVSGGEKICGKDENDYPVITFGTDRCYSILDALTELIHDEQNVVHLHRYMGEFPIYDEQVKMMQEDRALFSWILMRVVERLRGMETDFGILPLPKLDKAQKDYITNNNPNVGVGVSVPVVASDPERTGMILEDLCAESKYTLQPAYYEINLRGKYARDDESQEMLDILLSNTAYDIGYIYDFGGFGAGMVLWSGMNKKTDYASAFEKAKGKMEKDIEKTIEAYENARN